MNSDFKDRSKAAFKSSLATNGIWLAFTSIIIFATIAPFGLTPFVPCGFYGLESLEIAITLFTTATVFSAALGLIVGYLQKESVGLTKAVTILCAVIFGGLASLLGMVVHCGM
jgi:hypothetical protein